MAQKKHNLEILAPARNEIHEIARLHLALVGPVSARKITDKIKDSLAHLRTYPLMGMPVEDKTLRQLGYRRLICGNYLCFYRLEGDNIYLHHVADGRTDYKKIFTRMATKHDEKTLAVF